MKDFRPLKPNCNQKEPDIRQILRTLGVDNVATKADLLNIWWDNIKGIPNFTQLIRDRIVELDPDKAIGIINEITADWNDDVGEPGYIRNKPTKLSQFENDERFLSEEEVEGKINEKTSEYTNLNTQIGQYKSQINSEINQYKDQVSGLNNSFDELKESVSPAENLSNMLRQYPNFIQSVPNIAYNVKTTPEVSNTGLTIKVVKQSDYDNLVANNIIDNTVIYFIEE